MKTLANIRVLWAAAVAGEHQHDSLWLQSEGAELQLCAWSDLVKEAQRNVPSVIVADLRSTAEADVAPVFAELQTTAALRASPVVAIVPATQSSAARPPSEMRVSKYLTAPFHPSDLIHALAGLISPSLPSVPSSPGATFESVISAQVARRDLRGLLALLNATGPFRYTALLRFDGERLTSVWTFDRDNPSVDSFPVDKKVRESYCALVLETDAPFSMPDAAAEPKVQNHPARHTVLSYCGVPLRGDDGTVYGTLCQFDVVPRAYRDLTLQRLLDTAKLVEPHLGALSPPRAPTEAT